MIEQFTQSDIRFDELKTLTLSAKIDHVTNDTPGKVKRTSLSYCFKNASSWEAWKRRLKRGTGKSKKLGLDQFGIDGNLIRTRLCVRHEQSSMTVF